MITYAFDLDIVPGGVPVVVPLKQYEDDVVLSFNVYSRLGTLNLPSGTSVSIRGTKPDGNGFSSDTGVTFSNNVVTVNVDKQMTAAAGKSLFEFVFTNNNKELITTSFVIMVQRAALDKDTLASASVIKELVNVIDRTDEIIAAASTADDAKREIENAIASYESTLSESIDEINTGLANLNAGLGSLGQAASDYDTRLANSLNTFNNNLQATVVSAQQTIEDKSDEVGSLIDEYYEDLQDAQLVMESKVDGAYVEDGYLYLTSDGSIVAGPLGPFSGTGGGGGSGGGSSLYTITLLNTMASRALTVPDGTPVSIQFSYASEDDNGEDDGDGVGTLYIDGSYAGTYSVSQGNNSINITKHLRVGNNRIKFTVENSEGNSRSLSYTANVISLSVTTTMNDMAAYSGQVIFNYTPTGSGTKVMHFVMDGVELGTEEVLSSGRSRSYIIPEQTHGGHIFECYATMTVDGISVTSNVIKIGMVFVSNLSMQPAVSAIANKSSADQGETINVSYMVYDPAGELTNVTLSVIDASNNVYSSQTITVDRAKHEWSTQDYPAGNVKFRVACGNVQVDCEVNVAEYVLPVEPVTDGLLLEFDATGRSNAENNPEMWSFNDIEAEFSGFGWNNADGWLTDEGGASILRFLPGNSMTIPFEPFANDARQTGLTIEVEMASRDVRDYTSIILSCFSGGRGFKIGSQEATLKSEQSTLSMMFKEDSHVRVTFVVEQSNLNRLIYIYINGIMCRAIQYKADDNFQQASPVGLTIGSESCGLDLYHIRCYRKGLTRQEQLDNFIYDRPTLFDRQEASNRNDIMNANEEVTISKLPASLPYMLITSTGLPSDKDAPDITGCTVEFVDQANSSKSFIATNVNMSVQGTSSAGYPVKNFKIKMLKAAESTLVVNGVAKTNGYELRDGDIPVKTFCLKADYASSESANNVELVELYNAICPYKTPPQVANSAVRQGIAGRPIVVFWKDVDSGEVYFVGKYNFNNDKSTSLTYGFDYSRYPNAESWEFLDNAIDLCLFRTGDMSSWRNAFEAREPDGNEDITKLTRVVQWVASTRRDAATGNALQRSVTYDGVTYTTDSADYRLAKFKAEFENYFIKSSALFYYLFTELFLMVDSRAKNMFLTTYDGTHWMFLPYDMDTAIGINNEGELVFDYNLEDTDIYNNGVVFNGQDSVLWNNVRDAFGSELKEMYNTLRSNVLFSYNHIKDAFEEHQSVWPEALWNEDAFVKYLQPFLINGIDNLAMLQGSKSSQRDWWLFNAFKYRDSKYESGDAGKDNIIQIRAFAKSSITVTPYSHIYAKAEFGNGRIAITRATRGVPVTLEDPSTDAWPEGTDTVVRIYSPDRLSSIGDLSAFNAGTADFSKATKLQSLKLGDGAVGYTNTHLSHLVVGNNDLLTTLDIRNCVNLAESVDLSGCPGLEDVNAEGSSITGLTLSNGGHLKTMTLPNTIAGLTIQNQKLFESLTMAGYANVETLRIENTPNVQIEAIVNNSNSLNRVRIIGVEWEAESETTLATTIAKLKTCIGMDTNGVNTDFAVVNGRVNVPSISASLFTEISETFPNLVVVVNNVPQYVITFMNYDGEVLHRAIVSEGANVVDPVTTGSISTPTRQGSDEVHYVFSEWSSLPTNVHTNQSVVAQFTESFRVRYMNGDTVLQTNYIVRGNDATFSGSNPTKAQTDQYTYTFSGWLGTQTNITSARDIIAQFTSTIRTYTVRFYNGSTLLQTKQVAYGSNAQYTGTTPVYSGTETNDYGAFTGWVPSNMTITGATDFVAEFEYTGSLVKNYLERTLRSFEDNEITELRTKAFYYFNNLESVSSTSVLSVGEKALGGQGSLQNVYLPNATSIGYESFYNQDLLGDVNLQSVTEVGGSAFYSVRRLIIDLPSATSIGYAAFNSAKVKHLLLRNTAQVCTYGTSSSTYDPTDIIHIYVPRALLNSYKTATNWSRLAAKFVALEDYTDDGTTTGVFTP